MKAESQPLKPNDWDALIALEKQFRETLENFWKDNNDPITILRNELVKGDRSAAIFVVRNLSPLRQQELFHELIVVGCDNDRFPFIIRTIINSFPKEWLKSNLKVEADRLEFASDDDEYFFRRFLEMCRGVDHDIVLYACKLASKIERKEIQGIVSDFRENKNSVS